MKLWILKPINPSDKSGPWHPPEDCAYGFVVRAKSEQQARELAASSGQTGDENSSSWLDANLTTCEPLESRGECGVVMVKFRHG